MREVVYPEFAIRFDPEPHVYWVSDSDAMGLPVWEPYPSATGILDDVFGAPSWGIAKWVGMRVGLKACLELSHRYDAFPDKLTAKELEALVIAEKLSTNHPFGKSDVAAAAASGTAVHYAAQHWAEFGEEIDPNGFPEREMGYVAALKDWVDTTAPTVLDVEQMVASKRHGYAGTLDLRTILPDGRLGIVDFKTSGSIYHPQYDYQLAMYELASQECGYPPTDFRAVLRLDESGTWEWYESPTLPEAVLPLLEVWEERKRIEAHVAALKAARVG